MSVFGILNKIYEKYAYHVSYKLNEDGIIVKEVRNDKYSLSKFNTGLTIILSIILFVLIFGITTHELNVRSQNMIYLETFYVNQLCFESRDLSQCYSIQSQTPIKIFMDIQDNTKTLFISGADD